MSSVMLTSTQRDAAQGMAAGAIATARGCLREARAWRLMSAERAAARYLDRRATARSWLTLAASERRRAAYYAQIACVAQPAHPAGHRDALVTLARAVRIRAAELRAAELVTS